MPDSRPNFLIVMSDEHDPRVSSPYGHPFVHTPSMQRLADCGIVFENSYCNSPLCVPSRASFVTGRYVYHVGVWDNGAALASDEPTWAHRLNAVGYDTALSGKMHFRGPDQLHGFKERLVEEIHGWEGYPAPDWESGVKRGGPRMRHRIEEAGPGDSTYQQYDEEVVRRSIDYLREPARQNRPWALCASLITPHFPLVVRQPYFDRYYPRHADPPRLPLDHLACQHPAHQRLQTHFALGGFSDAQIGRARAVYYGLITYFDDQLGKLLDALDASGQTENTVVIYVADHGEMHGEHGLWWKCTFYDPAARIPTIVAWPGRFPGGQRFAGVVSLVDVVRTVVDLAGPTDVEGLDGDSFAPLLQSEPQPWKDMAFSEYEAHGTVTPARMVRRGQYKLNYYHHEPPELYDLAADPDEYADLGTRPDYASIVRELTALALADWDPDEIERQVRASQRRRAILERGSPYAPHGEWTPAGRAPVGTGN